MAKPKMVWQGNTVRKLKGINKSHSNVFLKTRRGGKIL
jgi:hypothetical protein